MIEIKNTTIYKCEYCSKVYQLKTFAVNHHLKCRKNPENISKCSEFCTHLIKDEFEVLKSNYYTEWCENISMFKCSKLDKYVKPRWASDIVDYFCSEIPEVEKQPKECNHYKRNF
jgi:hypothetical protein